MNQFDNTKKYLITGGAGFIGFHLTKRLLSQGADVVGFDNLNLDYDKKQKLLNVLAELGYGRNEEELGRSPTFAAVAYMHFRRMGNSHGAGLQAAYIAAHGLYKVNNESMSVEDAVELVAKPMADNADIETTKAHVEILMKTFLDARDRDHSGIGAAIQKVAKEVKSETWDS